MKQIKTVQRRRDYVEELDKVVNELLARGWILTARFDTPGYSLRGVDYHPMYVAYLEREVEPVEDVNKDDGK